MATETTETPPHPEGMFHLPSPHLRCPLPGRDAGFKEQKELRGGGVGVRVFRGFRGYFYSHRWETASQPQHITLDLSEALLLGPDIQLHRRDVFHQRYRGTQLPQIH